MLPTAEQRQVIDWLSSEPSLPGFADVYQTAIKLLSAKADGHICLVSHAAREIMNRLAPNVLNIQSGRVDYVNLCEELKNDWRDEWNESIESLGDECCVYYQIPIHICQKVGTLIEKHQEGSRRVEDTRYLFFSTFLGYEDKQRIPLNIAEDWMKAKKWFNAHAHLRDKAFNSGVGEELHYHFSKLEGFLYSAASSQFERTRGLDEILEETNG